MIANYMQAVSVREPEPEINFVEYIQSTGTQYIDTGFKPNNDTRVVAEFQFTSIVSNDWQTIFGSRDSTNANPYAVFMDTTGQFRSDYVDTPFFPSGLNATTKYTIDKNKNVCSIGGKTVTNATGTFQQTNNMYLFACNQGGSIAHQSNMRLYSCQIYDNNVLIRDYAPALDPEGVPCLYEKLSEQYVYNSGTGSFTAPS